MSDEASQLRAFRITGKVQGVFFRVWTRDTALEMGLRGMVRNHNDGSVEAWAAGSPKVLDAFELRLWEGPEGASVEGVERGEPTGEIPENGFLILY